MNDLGVLVAVDRLPTHHLAVGLMPKPAVPPLYWMTAPAPSPVVYRAASRDEVIAMMLGTAYLLHRNHPVRRIREN